MIYAEYEEQKKLIVWWRELKHYKLVSEHYHLICTDTAAKRTKPQQIRYKAMGGESGTPDLFLAVPKIENTPGIMICTWHGLFIELKAPGREKEKNGGLTKEQIEKLKDIAKLHYRTFICYSAKEAQKAITDYLGLKI